MTLRMTTNPGNMFLATKVLFSLFLHSKLPVAVSIKSTLSISHAITAVKASSEQVSEEGEIAQTDNRKFNQAAECLKTF